MDGGVEKEPGLEAIKGTEWNAGMHTSTVHTLMLCVSHVPLQKGTKWEPDLKNS